MRVIDLFSGPGGLGTGFVQAGFDVQTAMDIDIDAVNTYDYNHENTDVQKQDVTLVDFTLKDYDAITGFVGGAPCQGFSNVNPKRTKSSVKDDERNNLIYEMVRVAEQIKPDFVLLENVQGVPAEIKNDIEKEFQTLGYSTVAKNIRCYDYGSVQIAKRWILIASLHGHVFPNPVQSKRTASEILIDKPSKMQPYQSTVDKINQIKVTDDKLWYRLPDGNGGYRTGYNYCMVRPDKPIGKILNPTKARYVRPDRTGYLSMDEIKLAQGFTLDYKFFGNTSSVGQQLANAVPVETSKIFAEAIKEKVVNGLQSLDYYFQEVEV